jgi:hypothetical protein
MVPRKGEMASQIYRQQSQSKSQDSNPKAARLTSTFISNQQGETGDRLQDVIQTYCDYFIRY